MSQFIVRISPSLSWCGRICSTFAVALIVFGASTALAERPSAMKLFPEESVVFIRMANAKTFGERLRDSSTGRMLRDPQLKPFVEHLYGSATELYAEDVESKLGISLADLKNLPDGEVAFAVVARPSGPPAFLLLIDQGDEPSVADRLLDRALELAEEKGAEFSTEKIGDVDVTVVRDADNQNRMLGAFERENTIVLATDADVLRGVLWHWDGGKAGQETSGGDEPEQKPAASESEESDEEEAEFVPGRKLAENDRFATILRECRRPQDPPPQLVFFVDPIELVRSVGHDKGGVQFVMGLLPSLGLDGLHGLGGAVTFSTDQYDDLSQFHLLLGNPRSGVLQLPAFEPGDTTPQPWVPHAIQSYLAFNGNLRATYDRLTALVDKYRYEGSVDKFVKDKISEKLGIDVPTQIIDNLKGRYTWMIGFDTPPRFRGEQHMIAAELKDEVAAIESLKTVISKYPDLFEERHFGNVTYYAIFPPRLKDMPEEERPASPFVGIMDGYIFLGGSCQQFERCIAARDGTAPRMADSQDYVRTKEVLGRETTGTTPVMFALSRYEETMRQWYGLLTSEKTRALIDEHKVENRYLAALAEALEQNEMPPFEVLAPYLAPGGGILYDTDSGYHGISFTLRNEPPK